MKNRSAASPCRTMTWPGTTSTGRTWPRAASSRAAGTPAKSGSAAARASVASNGLAGRVVDPPSSPSPTMDASRIAPPAAPSAGSAPTFTTRIGSTNAPTAADTVFSVISTPKARPRSSSGTSRWKTVVSTTSRTIEPAAVRPMASRAMPSTGNAPSAAAPTLTRKAPASSGRARRRRRTRTPDTTAPISPPTPIAAFRNPFACSPAFRTVTARMTVNAWMPPSKKPMTNWMRTSPETGRSGSCDHGEAAGGAAGAGSPELVAGPRSAAGASSASAASAAFLSPGRDGGSVHRIAAITRNDRPLSRNAMTTSPAAIRIPPIAGPTMKLRFPMLAQALFAGPSWRSSAARLGR